LRRTPYTEFFKPLLDKAAALLLCLLLSPLLAILALLVKCTSKGPVIFKQKRVGQGRCTFNMLKFRSMYTYAPSEVPTHLLKDASKHITPVGRFLRKSSLDELPQLFNILSGEMSFIGPRPALWNQDDLVAEREKYHANDALPGLTGWAQVTGRDELPIPVKAEKDGWYAAHESFGLDVRIAFKTLFSVFSAKGIVEGANGDRHE
jgi:O-antigen biosynthesis protein WbqP